MEEDERFELSDPFGPSVFKTDAIGHSATLPIKKSNLYPIQGNITTIFAASQLICSMIISGLGLKGASATATGLTDLYLGIVKPISLLNLQIP